jgi:hypothetical protein
VRITQWFRFRFLQSVGTPQAAKDRLTQPAGASRTNLADALGLLSRWRLSTTLGACEGTTLGACEGTTLGACEGANVSPGNVGLAVLGASEGTTLGAFGGTTLGACEGTTLGACDGSTLGAKP